MASKKYRKQLRALRIKNLCIKAVQIHYQAEGNRMMLDELKNARINYNTDISYAFAMVRMIRTKYFGYAHMRFQEWWLGFSKLRFTAPGNGKIRAKDIDVIEEK